MHAQRFACVLIEHGQHLIGPPRAQLVMHEFHAPDMFAVLRAQPDDGAVFVVEAFALLMALRELQAFFPPEPLDLLVIDHPAFKPEQLGDLAIAITAILFGEPDHGQAQRFIIVRLAGFVLLRGARHADRSASAPL